MEQAEIARLNALLDERTSTLMERESDLADRMEEIDAQKEELTAAVEELESKNRLLEDALGELRERNQELDQILYRASHDLRSPITSIVGVLNVLEHVPMSEMQAKCFMHIRDKTSQMDELLKSLSILSKTIMNDIHYSLVNIDRLIRGCLTDLKFFRNFESVVIRTDITGDPEIATDGLLVSILIKSLLTNALIFRDPTKDGLILVRAAVSKSLFEIEVCDDGEGIADAIRDEIFKIFYRGSERSIGSGLGLYIVKKIVDQLKGDIQFTRTDGLTKFSVVLPSPVGQILSC